jgi:hypothetical protein
MRSVWIALAAILAGSLLGAYLLGRALEKRTEKPSLAPRGARVLDERRLSDDQRVVTWRAGGHAEEPSSGLYGVTVVEGARRLYSHRARRGAEGLHVETGDFTKDGSADVLVFDALDGSGGCGVYRAVAVADGSVQEVSSTALCEDRGTIHLQRGGLVFRLGESKDPQTANDIHCCFRYLRTTLKRWNGSELLTVHTSRRRLAKPHPWPPGGYPPGGVA